MGFLKSKCFSVLRDEQLWNKPLWAFLFFVSACRSKFYVQVNFVHQLTYILICLIVIFVMLGANRKTTNTSLIKNLLFTKLTNIIPLIYQGI